MSPDAPSSSKLRVFVSFDIDHDEELFGLLLAQSRTPNSVFEVSGGSNRLTATDIGRERVRGQIREADQMIVLCGERTENSTGVSSEIRLAEEEGTPYFLLWGRREVMCTKPIGARLTEGMYSWTRQILRDQMLLASREADAGCGG